MAKEIRFKSSPVICPVIICPVICPVRVPRPGLACETRFLRMAVRKGADMKSLRYLRLYGPMLVLNVAYMQVADMKSLRCRRLYGQCWYWV